MKVEAAYIQVTTHKGKFQKYNFVMNKTVNNLTKTTDYEIVYIEDLVIDTPPFNIVAEIIVNELKQ